MVYSRYIYGCGPYYYESVRVGYRVKSIYLGKSIHNIQYVENIPKNYKGMNPEAGKELNVKCPNNTILVLNNLTQIDTEHTIKHEVKEYYLMKGTKKKKGLSYKEAHEKAPYHS